MKVSAAIVMLTATTVCAADATLSDTAPLTLERPVDEVMVEGIHRFCLRELAKSRERRGALWKRDFSSAVYDNQEFEAYTLIIKRAKWTRFSWKGLTLMKDPMTLTIYLQLIQELKPKSILEFGTFVGGSAL